jgi:hypothetical protein
MSLVLLLVNSVLPVNTVLVAKPHVLIVFLVLIPMRVRLLVLTVLQADSLRDMDQVLVPRVLLERLLLLVHPLVVVVPLVNTLLLH